MKSATDLTSLKAELKLILSKDLYDNIFNRDNLSYSEIQFTLESLRNIRLNLSGIHYSFKERLVAQQAYKDIRKSLYTYTKLYMIPIYVFAEAIYILDVDKLTYYTTDEYTIFKAPIGIPLQLCDKFKYDDVYFILSEQKVIGAFYEDMRECRVITTSTNEKIKLPIIRNKEVKSNILSAITLLKLGGKI